jgi:hypothetical protein
MKKRILLLAVFTLICAMSFAVAAKPGKVKADEAEKTNFHFSINLRPSDETMEKIQYKYMFYRYLESNVEKDLSENSTVTIPISEILGNLVALEYNSETGTNEEFAVTLFSYKNVTLSDNNVSPDFGCICDKDSQSLVFSDLHNDCKEICVYLDIEPEVVSVKFSLNGAYNGKSYSGEIYVPHISRADIEIYSIYGCMETGSGDDVEYLSRNCAFTKIGDTSYTSTGNKGEQSIFSVTQTADKKAYGPYAVSWTEAIKDISYDTVNDLLVVTTALAGQEICILNTKKAAGIKLTAEQADETMRFLRSEYDKSTDKNIVTYPIGAVEDEGLNIAAGKGAFIYVSADGPKWDEENEKAKFLYEPNFVIEPTQIKKVDFGLNYAGASVREEAGYLSAISEVTITKTTGDPETYSLASNEDALKNFLSSVSFGWMTQEGKEKWTEWYDEKAFTGEERALELVSAPEGIGVGYRMTSWSLPDTVSRISLRYTGPNYTDWEFVYDSQWGTKRYYTYTAYKNEEGEDNHISLQPDHWKNTEYIEIYKDENKYSILTRLIDPSNKSDDILYEDTLFEKRNGDYYSESGKKLSDYGIYVWLSGLSEEDRILIKVAESSDVSDLGFIVGIRYGYSESNLNLTEGVSTIIYELKDAYALSNEELGDRVFNLTEAAFAKDKTKHSLVLHVAGSYDSAEKKYYRCSKDYTIAIKKAAKMVKVKYDLKKDMIVIKNGFDYRLSSDYEWKTVLPYNKNGTAAKTTINTIDYHPPKKAANDLSMFTAEKYTGIPVDSILGSEGIEVEVRKSAGYASPATDMEFCEKEQTCILFIDRRANAPVLTAKNGSYGKEDDKHNIILPAINRAVSDTAVIAKVSYEYMVIDKADYEAELKNPGTLDKTSFKWSKYQGGKKITIDKTKSKYKKTADEGKATDHLLVNGSYILIRRAGDKNKKDPYSPILASECVVLKVVETTVDGETRHELVPVE